MPNKKKKKKKRKKKSGLSHSTYFEKSPAMGIMVVPAACKLKLKGIE
jgi:hypothetical protein